MSIEDEIDELDEIRADARDNVEGLKRKNRELLGELKKLKQRLADKPPEPTPREKFLQDAARRLVGLEDDAKAAEVAKLEAEMAPLIDAEVAEHGRQLQQRLEGLSRTATRLMRDNAATQVVMRIRRPGIDPTVLAPFVLERLDVQETDGEFSVIGKGPNGEPISLEALAEELRGRSDLAPLVAGACAEEKAAHAAKVAETLGQRPNGAAH